MKKTIVILISLFMALTLLASCGSSGFKGEYMTDSNESAYSGSGSSGAVAPSMEPRPASPDYDYSYADSGESGPYAAAGITPVSSPSTDEGFSEKIIHSVSADIETVNFDLTIEKVYQLLALNNAFIESSYIGGRNYEQQYRGVQTYRTANFVLRVPKDRLRAMTESLEQLGNVPNKRSDAINITAQFTDTQSRLNSLYIQEERLLDMLSRAEVLEDMITLEYRLSEIRYQIESIASTLRNWQNQVDYSTVSLFIREVETFTEIVPVQQRTYMEQIGDGFSSTLRAVGDFFMGLFKWIVVNLPVLVILAIIAVAAVIITKRKLKKSRAKREKLMSQPGYMGQPVYAGQPRPMGPMGPMGPMTQPMQPGPMTQPVQPGPMTQPVQPGPMDPMTQPEQPTQPEPPSQE